MGRGVGVGVVVGVVATAGAAVAGCGPQWTQRDDVEGLSRWTAAEATGSGGTAVVEVPSEAVATTFLMQIKPFDAGMEVFLDDITGPGGTPMMLDALTSASQGIYLSGAVSAYPEAAINYPVRAADPAWTGGVDVRVGAVDANNQLNRWVDLDVELLVKDDPDLSRGTLALNLVRYASAADEPALDAALEVALPHFLDIYEQVGITVELTEVSVDGELLLPPSIGDEPAYQALSEGFPVRSVTLVLTPDIVGGADGLLGFAGGIPGPLGASGRSAVVVSTTANAGDDLVFSETEALTLGETMAHEVGHYLGLFHPVEVSFNTWDGLADTVDCANQVACDAALAANLMYPVVVCDGGECVSQQDLTEGQGGVMNRYTGVR